MTIKFKRNYKKNKCNTILLDNDNQVQKGTINSKNNVIQIDWVPVQLLYWAFCIQKQSLSRKICYSTNNTSQIKIQTLTNCKNRYTSST
jgi:hypothetical protein